MASQTGFAEIAALAGDPARAGMLHALMDGRALTATELAQAAGVTPQTASGHLARMTAAGLLGMEKQGRHRYHRLASPAVARMVEGIMQVASQAAMRRKPVVTGPQDAALRSARTCYDHLAGRLAVAVTDAMVQRSHLELSSDAGLLTDSGVALFARLGIDATSMRPSGRVLCRPCLDWSERRPHLAGALGAALCTHCLTSNWVRRVKGTRAVSVTPKGQQMFNQTFGITLSHA